VVGSLLRYYQGTRATGRLVLVVVAVVLPLARGRLLLLVRHRTHLSLKDLGRLRLPVKGKGRQGREAINSVLAWGMAYDVDVLTRPNKGFPSSGSARTPQRSFLLTRVL
jgi:hypothetical protein